LIGDSPDQMADAVVRVLRDRELGRSLAHAAAQHVTQFSWTRIGERLDAVLTRARLRHASAGASRLTYAADTR
jgi:glycosyltransferase involved in cell wall biosynthesis